MSGKVDNKNKKQGNSNNNRSRRNNRNSNNRRDGDNMVDVRGSGSDSNDKGCYRNDNDPRWYGSVESVRDAASLAFSNVSGSPVTFGEPGTVIYPEGAFPGILVANWVPTYFTLMNGPTELYTQEATNIAGKQIYSFVRHANSGAKNYSWQDMMLTIMGADQIFSMLAAGIRAYGLIMQYEQKNRYIPEALVSALGFNAADLRNHLADFLFGLNLRIRKSSVMWIPMDLPITARHFWMNSEVYMDNASAKAQFYAYKQALTYKFSPVTEMTGSSLVPVAIPNNMTVDQYFTLIDTMMEPIITDNDCGIIFGDIRKAYTPQRIFTMKEIAPDYSIQPTFSQEVLLQIHNSMALPLRATPSVLPTAITQATGTALDAGQLVGSIYAVAGPSVPDAERILDMYGRVSRKTILNFKGSEIPSPDMIMVATRCHGIQFTDNPKMFHTGTEAINSYTIYHYDANQEIAAFSTMNVISSDDPNRDKFVTALSYFDWAPICYLCSEEADGGTITGRPILDIDNYTYITDVELVKMNTTAALGSWDIPSSLNR